MELNIKVKNDFFFFFVGLHMIFQGFLVYQYKWSLQVIFLFGFDDY